MKIVASAILTMAAVGLAAFFSVAGQTRSPKEVAMKPDGRYDVAIFAGGCFWCVESAFEGRPGVLDVISGYTGGHGENPTYEQVSSGRTGHAEAIQILFDPEKITYQTLLTIFFQQIDPTDAGGSFVDRGTQYRSAVFFTNDRQKAQALDIIQRINNAGIFDAPVATQVVKASKFYEAEAYHQDYHRKNPIRYKFYRAGSGRDRFIEKFWKNGNASVLNRPANARSGVSGEPASNARIPDDDTLKQILTPLQYKVTRKNGTEPAFHNPYWDNKEEGIYVDIISGTPLFSSRDKFDSGTGWPSFSRPLDKNDILEKQDRSLFAKRIEVRSRSSDAHLGHLFNDGPGPTGLRYCINSAALRFIPKEALETEGYGHLNDWQD